MHERRAVSATTAAQVRQAFATAAMVLVVVYVAIDVVLQFLPPHYSVLSDAESDLAVGPFGWAMQVNFAARAVMSGCVVVAVALTPPASSSRRVGSALLAAAGACSAALVFFATDVNREGEFGMRPHTGIGVVHVVFASTGFIAVLIAMIVLTGWLGTVVTRHRTVTAFLVMACVGLLLLALSLLVLPQVVGVTERLCLAGILGWAFTLSARLRALPAG